MKERITTGNMRKIITICIAIAFVVIVLGMYTLNFTDYKELVPWLNLSSESGTWGSFGDFVGGLLNPIFSFLALIALLHTITLQSKELAYTRRELARAADAHENSKEIMALQSDILKQQQFEGTFFNLLDIHEKRLNALTDPSNRDIPGTYGHSAMYYAKIGQTTEVIKEYYSVFNELLKFISNNFPTQSYDAKSHQIVMKKENYSNIIKATLSSDLIELLHDKYSKEAEPEIEALLKETNFFEGISDTLHFD